ncbi:hypothetical protein UFOVP626_57 [uncultured Caudovirales phage]|uniref:Uncharacterized protein n=1 Tax=uncultured Caudovirales phage TaxID=2100421 RepID=A0A6J5QJK5_9CAUD|nr:hypothetical protein UFOVP626_57 [uncultured Caudovirales phage]CAB4173365.1 hypothetical protein UFOVP951_52 [uncultured Caudovirales phage]CAB4184810.1 hypothetical protein UFOVP1115_39 [uncultured Caudovirales phage]CAB4203804.1 hypothetical protein UFOVP1390_3 [uncultured Caudovirales phage]CAB5238413.1 hypothetical protein UFOVP1567_38 [uncultured Caudovirales phage]
MNCNSGAICPHNPQCDHICQATETRKIKPYPAIPEDIPPVSDQWHKIGAFMLWCIFAVLLTICLALFFTGVWIWSLLI